jgi:hypothetical protein
MYLCLIMGFGLVIGFIDHMQIVTTSNCSPITNSHTLQFAVARIKFSQFVFTSVHLVMAPNNADSSASEFNGSCPHWLAAPSQLLMAAALLHS